MAADDKRAARFLRVAARSDDPRIIQKGHEVFSEGIFGLRPTSVGQPMALSLGVLPDCPFVSSL